LYVFAKHVKCENVWGEGMNDDVDVGESSTKRRRLNSVIGDPPFKGVVNSSTNLKLNIKRKKVFKSFYLTS